MSLGLSQAQMGARVAEIARRNAPFSQVTVVRWEKGEMRPRPSVLAALMTFAADADKDWWREQAGLPMQDQPRSTEDVKRIPLYKGRIAAGIGREIEGEIEDRLPLPRGWFPPGSHMIALRVEGDSMKDLILSGYYVLIDTSVREIRRLVDHMVAMRAPHGCTVKWLRKQETTPNYLLIPQHTSPEFPIMTITPETEHEFEIIGRVLKWIGEPSPPRRR